MLGQVWNYCKENRILIFDHSKNLRAPQTCAYATLRQSVANLMFHNVSFNFATAISKFDTFSSYHIICAQIAKVTASSFLFELSELVCTRNLLYPISFFLFELSEFVCTKNVFYPILLFPLLSHPKLLPLWSVPDGQHSSPPVTYFFFYWHWARGALPAGATLLGWPNYGVDGRLNKAREDYSWVYLKEDYGTSRSYRASHLNFSLTNGNQNFPLPCSSWDFLKKRYRTMVSFAHSTRSSFLACSWT
jgi:hypothetical protein